MVDKTQPESTKRGVAILAALTLCVGSLGLTSAIMYQAAFKQKVDGTLVGASIGCNSIVAGLAGVAYRKKESDEPEASPSGTENA